MDVRMRRKTYDKITRNINGTTHIVTIFYIYDLTLLEMNFLALAIYGLNRIHKSQ